MPLHAAATIDITLLMFLLFVRHFRFFLLSLMLLIFRLLLPYFLFSRFRYAALLRFFAIDIAVFRRQPFSRRGAMRAIC